MADRVAQLLAAPHEAGHGPGLLVDATVGPGGHAAALLAASSEQVRLLGLDRDPEALERAADRLASFGDRVVLVHGNHAGLDEHLAEVVGADEPVLAVLYDLGVSSPQLDEGERGFSFQAEAPLDMRMDPSSTTTAADLVNERSVASLVELIRGYGEERFASRIAAAIGRARPLTTTRGLADVVAEAVPAPARRHAHRHPATRTFQALRIAVNDELDSFSASLPQALEATARPAGTRRGGRVATLAYHSLEDRAAKQAFTDAATGCICPPDLPVCGCGRTPLVRRVTRGAERPSESEVAVNSRARSARLRVVERTSDRGGDDARRAAE
jgi:16S rRNA (cytosine1402-N4)-methyltransferase